MARPPWRLLFVSRIWHKRFLFFWGVRTFNLSQGQQTEPFSCHGDLESIATRAIHIPLSHLVHFSFFSSIKFWWGKTNKQGKQIPILVSQIASSLIAAKRLVRYQRALILPWRRLYLAWHTWTPAVSVQLCSKKVWIFLVLFISNCNHESPAHCQTLNHFSWWASPGPPVVCLPAARRSDLISAGSGWSLDSRILLLARISCSAALAALLTLSARCLRPPAQCLCSHFQTVFLLAASHKIPQQRSPVWCHVAYLCSLMNADG